MNYDTKGVNTTDFEKLPPGNFQAVVVGVYGLGLQRKEYKDNETGEMKPKLEKQARIIWEINKEDSTGAKFFLGKTYNLSTHEMSTMAKHMKSWLGVTVDENFDLSSVNGKNCLLTVVTSKSDYPVIASVGPLPEGMPEIAAEKPAPDGMLRKIDELRGHAVSKGAPPQPVPAQDTGDTEQVGEEAPW